MYSPYSAIGSVRSGSASRCPSVEKPATPQGQDPWNFPRNPWKHIAVAWWNTWPSWSHNYHNSSFLVLFHIFSVHLISFDFIWFHLRPLNLWFSQVLLLHHNSLTSPWPRSPGAPDRPRITAELRWGGSIWKGCALLRCLKGGKSHDSNNGTMALWHYGNRLLCVWDIYIYMYVYIYI